MQIMEQTKYKCLDTNILLLDAHNLINLGKDGSVIVIPETVLDEIDSKKSGFNEIAFQAREFSRLLSNAEDIEQYTTVDYITSELLIDDVTVHLVSCKEYPDFKDTEANIINDRKIIHVAEIYRQPVEFVTNDIACKHRAKSLGIKVSELKQVENTDIDFVKDVELTDDTFRVIHDKPIVLINPDHKPNYFNYKFVNMITGQVKLANIVNGLVKVIGKDTEKDIRAQDVNPSNAEQLFFAKALLDTSIDINVCEAKAGSGKTLVAISNGIRLVRQGHYESLIYIRASVDDVDKAEEIGFLAGNDEKLQVYLHPLEDSLDYIVRQRYKDKRKKTKQAEFDTFIGEEISKLKNTCNIEPMIGLGLRGRTFHNAYVIIDEAQNQTKSSLQKTLTRFGKGCKIVVIGSNKQIDNPFITKYTNGLSVLLEACGQPQEDISLHAVSLPKVLRGPIAQFAEDLYSKN